MYGFNTNRPAIKLKYRLGHVSDCNLLWTKLDKDNISSSNYKLNTIRQWHLVLVQVALPAHRSRTLNGASKSSLCLHLMHAHVQRMDNSTPPLLWSNDSHRHLNMCILDVRHSDWWTMSRWYNHVLSHWQKNVCSLTSVLFWLMCHFFRICLWMNNAPWWGACGRVKTRELSVDTKFDNYYICKTFANVYDLNLTVRYTCPVPSLTPSFRWNIWGKSRKFRLSNRNRSG